MTTIRVILIIQSVLGISQTTSEKYTHPCDSLIYCYGNLLHVIQTAELSGDSKTFVDMSLLHPPTQVLENFNLLMKKSNTTPTKTELQSFLANNFGDVDTEMDSWYPSDWEVRPKVLERISDPSLKVWATQIHALWPQLGRKLKANISESPDRYSQIYVPNPVIVPGGRFREFYYWDTYWVVKGLLISEMFDTAKGMIENLLYMVEKYGFVPNGGRVYLTDRSQPPYLIPMVNIYYQATRDTEFLKKHLNLMEKELKFWTTRRKVWVEKEGMKYALYRYGVLSDSPRPEAYREDLALASQLSTNQQRIHLYSNIHSAAESGWDFSTRWIIKEGTNKGNLKDISTRNIIPVDLNSLICYNMGILSKLYSILGDEIKAQQYAKQYDILKEAIRLILWNEERGVWLDFDLLNSRPRDHYYLSNVSPLWSGCHHGDSEITSKVITYLRDQRVLNYPGGVPTSLLDSSQQWDYPIGWAPLQQMLIESLASQDSTEANELALDLAQRWISVNHENFLKYGSMFEKYDVTESEPGDGGEYPGQIGFGWTNGVVLYLLDKYGDNLVAKPTIKPNLPFKPRTTLFATMILLSVLICCCRIHKFIKRSIPNMKLRNQSNLWRHSRKRKQKYESIAECKEQLP